MKREPPREEDVRAMVVQRIRHVGTDQRTCGHAKLEADECRDCLLELGRRQGHVEAGGFKNLADLREALTAGVGP